MLLYFLKIEFFKKLSIFSTLQNFKNKIKGILFVHIKRQSPLSSLDAFGEIVRITVLLWALLNFYPKIHANY